MADSYQTNGEVLQDFLNPFEFRAGLEPTMMDTDSILSLKDALNNSFPGVLRLGYFSDGANLS